MQIALNTIDVLLIISGFGAIQFIVGVWIKVRLEYSIKSEYDKIIEDYRFDLKAREQAATAAEYIALARNLQNTSSEADYRRANQLAWELALWLPAQLYRDLSSALGNPQSAENNILAVLVKIRKLLLTDSGNLTADDIIHHAPNIGAFRSLQQGHSSASKRD
jgi:hypothetical protein